MAFKPVKQAANLVLPCRIEDFYLVPYSWMAYGLNNGLLTIQDNSFYTSLQGAAYCQALNLNLPFYTNGGMDPSADIWLRVEEGRMQPVRVWTDYFNPDMCALSKYLKMPVYPIVATSIHDLNVYNQMTVNNSIIQLLKGCHIKLESAVWGNEWLDFPEVGTAKNQVTRRAIWQIED